MGTGAHVYKTSTVRAGEGSQSLGWATTAQQADHLTNCAPTKVSHISYAHVNYPTNLTWCILILFVPKLQAQLDSYIIMVW